MQDTGTTAAGYSADTEILTRNGWRLFPDLSRTDEFAARTPGGRFEWQRATRIVRDEPHDGEMIRFHGRAVDLLIAPAHPVLWMPDARGLPRLSPAAELADRKLARPRATATLSARSAWEAPDLAEKVFPGVRHTKMGPKPRDVRMTGDQYAAFMGMYAAEGNATPTPNDWLVMISQTRGGKGYDEYREMLTAIFGREPGKSNYGTTWVLHSRALYDFLRPLGKATGKWLPSDVLELSRRQLEIFWHYYFLGDGSYEVRPGKSTAAVAATASTVLAGQLQEIVQKLGASAAVCTNRTRATSLVASEGLIYKVRIRRTECPAFAVDPVPYSGTVGRVVVPAGIVYVRRNGKPAWCG
jgi:hypothetical protein